MDLIFMISCITNCGHGWVGPKISIIGKPFSRVRANLSEFCEISFSFDQFAEKHSKGSVFKSFSPNGSQEESGFSYPS